MPEFQSPPSIEMDHQVFDVGGPIIVNGKSYILKATFPQLILSDNGVDIPMPYSEELRITGGRPVESEPDVSTIILTE